MRRHRRQPTRLPHPWDSPGKNTGVGCHFLLQCMKVESESEVIQSCPTLSDSMDCSLPGSSVHGFSRQEYWSGVPLPSLIVTAAMKLRRLLLGRKTMTNLDSVLKSRTITLPAKVHLVKAIVFPVVMHWCKSWTITKAECWRIDALNCNVGKDSWESLGL